MIESDDGDVEFVSSSIPSTTTSNARNVVSINEESKDFITATTSTGCIPKNPDPIRLSHYQCIRLEPNAELEFIANRQRGTSGSSSSSRVRKRNFGTSGTQFSGQSSDDNCSDHSVTELNRDFHEQCSTVDDNISQNQRPNNNNNSNSLLDSFVQQQLYFLILSGDGESFGTKLITKNRLYQLKLGYRYLFQTFSGFEICFLSNHSSIDIVTKFLNNNNNFPNNNNKNFRNYQHNNRNQTRQQKNQNFIETKQKKFFPLNSNGVLLDNVGGGRDNQTVYNAVMRQLSREQQQNLGQNRGGNRGISQNRKRFVSQPKPNDNLENVLVNVECSNNVPIGTEYGGAGSIRINCTVKSFRNSPQSWLYQSYVKFAQKMNQLREAAATTTTTGGIPKRSGPNVMIVGPCDAGKSSLSRLLINYATNDGYSPIYVDLDLGQGSIGLPGIIGAGIVDGQLDIGDWDNHQDSTFRYRPDSSYLVHFGSVTPGNERDIHQLAVSCLERHVTKAIQVDEQNYRNYCPKDHGSNGPKKNEMKAMLTKWSGMVVNTHGWIHDYGYESTLDAIRLFRISHICVLGDYRLFDRIYRDLNNGQAPPGQIKDNNRHRTNTYPRDRGPSSSGPVNINNNNARNNPSKSSNVQQQQQKDNNNFFEISFFQPNLSTNKRSNRLRRKLRFNRFERYFTTNPDHRMATVLIPFEQHSIFRFYLKSSAKFNNFINNNDNDNNQNIIGRSHRNNDNNKNNNWPKSSEPSHAYLSCQFRKTRNNNKQEAVFYYLNPSVLVYLLNRILSIMEITSEKLLAGSSMSSTAEQEESAPSRGRRHPQSSSSSYSWFTLSELLTVKGFARISQIDLENEQLEIQLPYRFTESLREGQLVLLLNETNFDEDDSS